MEFIGVKNLPEGQEGDLCVLFSKSQPDAFFDAKRRLSILSVSREKQVASFRCEPTGELLFELMSSSSSKLSIRKSTKTLGSASFSMKDYLDPVSKLYVEKWLELVPGSGTMSSKPILLRVAISFTVPVLAPYTLEMTQSRPFSKNTCLFNLPVRPQHAKSWTHVTDENGTRIISLQMRYSLCMHFMPDINRSSLPKCVHHFLMVMLGTSLLVIYACCRFYKHDFLCCLSCVFEISTCFNCI